MTTISDSTSWRGPDSARTERRKPKPLGYPAQFVFSIKDYNEDNKGGRRRVEDYGKTWDMLLRKAGLPDFENLGHAQEVNQSNYRGEDDDQALAVKRRLRKIRAKYAPR